jgi:hypothetical protein
MASMHRGRGLLGARIAALLAAVLGGLAAPGAAHAVLLAAEPARGDAGSEATQPRPVAADLAGVARLANGCSAVLLAGGRHLLGAAHCHGAVGSYVRFGADASAAAPTVDAGADRAPRARVVAVSLAPGWAGTPPSHDLAVMTLDAPMTAVPGYRLASEATVSGAPWVLVAGYGAGGTPAAPQPAGVLRWGRNEYDGRLPPAEPFGGRIGGRIAIFDFDDGSFGANTIGLMPGGVSSLGLGADEAMLAGLDSGGPSFVAVPRTARGGWPAWWPRWLGGAAPLPAVEWQIAGIHAVIETTRGTRFGGLGMDTLVAPYAAWIASVAGPQVLAGAALPPHDAASGPAGGR